jgi:hypothetical protein
MQPGVNHKTELIDNLHTQKRATQAFQDFEILIMMIKSS